MTSKPASRSARATTFAPRSCPSRPGLATRMRSLRGRGRGGGHRQERSVTRGRAGGRQRRALHSSHAPSAATCVASHDPPRPPRRRPRRSRAHPRAGALREARARGRRHRGRPAASTSSGRPRAPRRSSAEDGGRRLVGFALFFHNYSTFLCQPGPLPGGPLRAARAAAARATARAPAARSRGSRSSAGAGGSSGRCSTGTSRPSGFTGRSGRRCSRTGGSCASRATRWRRSRRRRATGSGRSPGHRLRSGSRVVRYPPCARAGLPPSLASRSQPSPGSACSRRRGRPR